MWPPKHAKIKTPSSQAKRLGYSDVQLAKAWGMDFSRDPRLRKGVWRVAHLQNGRHLRGRIRVLHALPLQHLRERERGRAQRQKKIMIIGGGPNRIGQGIEFDYCCVHASMALAGSWF